jgi:cold-inducible RNA-binding protein
MSSRLYVGNLPFDVTEQHLTQHFATCGEVRSVTVMMDRESGRSRGFAFVEMATPDLARKAISELDGKDLGGRSLRVAVAQERERGGGGGGGGDRRRGR